MKSEAFQKGCICNSTTRVHQAGAGEGLLRYTFKRGPQQDEWNNYRHYSALDIGHKYEPYKVCANPNDRNGGNEILYNGFLSAPSFVRRKQL